MAQDMPGSDAVTGDDDVVADAAHSVPEVLTIETVESLTADLRLLNIPASTCLRLDMSAVQIITTPAIQLLLALAKHCVAQGGALALHSVPDSVKQAFVMTGCNSLVCEPHLQAGR